MWGPPHRLGDGLNADTEESCTSYNILKVARHLFSWGADPGYADFYERVLWNGCVVVISVAACVGIPPAAVARLFSVPNLIVTQHRT